MHERPRARKTPGVQPIRRHAVALPPSRWALALSLLLPLGCSAPVEDALELGVARQATVFPPAASWIPIQQADLNIGDIETDGANNGREIVGSSSLPAVFIFADDLEFSVRLRLNSDPTSGSNVRPFGWGLLIDTDGNFNAYEFSVMIDGTGNPRRVVFAQNTSPGTTGSPQDTAETELSSIPINMAVGGNVAVSVADSTIGGDADFFLDFSVPLSALKNAGITLSRPLRIFAGTSSSANSLSVDLAGTGVAPGAGTLALAASDPAYLDGTDADMDGDGVLNPSDLDNDNDGVTDARENTFGVDPDADHDIDGIPNWRDASDRGDGTSAGCTDSGADGVCDTTLSAFDTDGDRRPNHNDLDADNDGIPDVKEAGHGATDANSDGMVDGAVGTNGFRDSLETSAGSGVSNYALLNTDGDSASDFRDLDSDGDGAFDVAETGRSALDANADGRIDTSTTDVDRDGILSNVDANDAVFGFPSILLPDADVDGIPNPYDKVGAGPAVGDSDADGLSDTTECPGGWPCPDSNSDGTPNYMTNSPDTDSDGVNNVDDVALADPSRCRDVDNDTCDDCTNTGANLSGGSTSNDGLDTDVDGICNAGDTDDDNDGVLDGPDASPTNPNLCRDLDTDTCDDCSVTGANNSGGSTSNDGLDSDADTLCNAGDNDDDNDGVTDGIDIDPFDPNACGDDDGDFCEDCVNTGADSSGGDLDDDGLDTDADGLCNLGDSDSDDDGVVDGIDRDPIHPNVCQDIDLDTCDDCTNTGADLSGGDTDDDGTDSDLDGLCDAGDADVDEDGVSDAADVNPLDANRCRDLDRDTCDDCAITGADQSGGDTAADGQDTDLDGICDAGEADLDEDGVTDGLDVAPSDPNRCRDLDLDSCDDCTNTGPDLGGGDVLDDGVDADLDGICDAGETDLDQDGVVDGADTDPSDPAVCRDTDRDSCDDCATTGADSSGGAPDDDGLDTDGDGLCDASDLDLDADGVPNAQDSQPAEPTLCRDLDTDTCDDCSVTGANNSGGSTSNDGLDSDVDTLCNAGDPDDDNDGVLDGPDSTPTNANLCRDLDTDTCNDCAITGANDSGGSSSNDGLDTDVDGRCDVGDTDDDNDGVLDGDDSEPLDPALCADSDADFCDDCSRTGADESGGDPRDDGVDTDADGLCNLGDGDSDEDGVADGEDENPIDPNVCQDADEDTCDDCTRTGADRSSGDVDDDGVDFDGDGICDAGETDFDSDGVPDVEDDAPSDPRSCRDLDQDTCDDCSFTGGDNSGGDVAADGPDLDLDGTCDAGEVDLDNDGVTDLLDDLPNDPQSCRDVDNDTCNDCIHTGANHSGGATSDDGTDSDLDGVCDAGESDLDADGVVNGADGDQVNPHVCRDLDQDGCDDCSGTGADQSAGDALNDGLDTDADGVCDSGDADDDQDGVSDTSDREPIDANRCADVDGDSCDDCSLTGADRSGGDVSNDGQDTDQDGTCDVGEADRDDDGVPDPTGPVESTPSIPRGVHVQGGGLNCSLQGLASPHVGGAWPPLALLLALALRRKRARDRSPNSGKRSGQGARPMGF